MPRERQLDEIGWRDNPDALFMGGIHNNTVLYYFAQSSFYDKTSNNEILFQQGCNNPNMAQFLATRELFEGRLRTMSGLEFVVAQEPAETGPGAGTGVWVINKQTRRKRQGEEDEIIVHSTYFLCDGTIFMAPSLADVLSMRIAHISHYISQILPQASEVQTWSPSHGRVYNKPPVDKSTSTATADDETAPPEPAKLQLRHQDPTDDVPPPSLFDDILMIHEHHGHHYMDENPITGKPGEFILSSTGRPKLSLLPAPANKGIPPNLTGKLPALNTKAAQASNESPVNAKATKSPKTPGGGPGKLKRRKSKVAVTPS